MLGLSKKAGKAAIGQEAVSDAIRHGYAKLILIAADASDNTRERFERLTSGEDKVVHVVTPFTKQEIGNVLGRAECAIAAVCDAGMAAAIASHLVQRGISDEKFAERASRLQAEADRKHARKYKNNDNTSGGVR